MELIQPLSILSVLGAMFMWAINQTPIPVPVRISAIVIGALALIVTLLYLA